MTRDPKLTSFASPVTGAGKAPTLTSFGFAVGRTDFWQPLMQLRAGRITHEGAVTGTTISGIGTPITCRPSQSSTQGKSSCNSE